jgi:hypothetical protein
LEKVLCMILTRLCGVRDGGWQLAYALRKGPYQANLLLGGFDEKDGAALYFMDYLASLQVRPRGGRGEGGRSNREGGRERGAAPGQSQHKLRIDSLMRDADIGATEEGRCRLGSGISND